MTETPMSTGLAGLDRVLKGLMPGDNLVWQVDSLADFAPFVEPYCRWALSQGRRLVYFRFAEHAPLTCEEAGAAVCRLSPGDGFERFITQIHQAIDEAGPDAYFVFDCLSTLAEAWRSDRMLGNFFLLTCPYVYDRQSLAYFPVLRNRHSLDAINPIAQTTQIYLEVYRHREKIYVHPTKVQQRYSPTMYMLHVWDDDLFIPVAESSTIAEILTARPWAGPDSARVRAGKWNWSLVQAEEARRGAAEAPATVPELVSTLVTRQPRLARLAEQYLDLDDILAIWRRMIGTGLIGGKAVGMLLARAILRKTDPRWNEILEPHDSFFIASDVFYSFLVENGCWWLRQRQQEQPPGPLPLDVGEARRRILMGNFPEPIVREFAEMLDYFGQSPIIVRSSSLLEDNYGNAFSGKYESVFCANQGSHHRRLQDFLSAVRTIYASSMGEKALRYRAQRGLLDRDEQMALLVQRVSGTRYGNLYYPHVAGVGLSCNPYVWNKRIDPRAGMLRLVFGLGTRAVDRSDDDYTRIVALNAPDRRPETDFDEVRQFSQRKVDVIDLEANQLTSYDFARVARKSPGLPIGIVATDRRPHEHRLPQQPVDFERFVLTFDHLLGATPFVGDVRAMLATLEAAYQYPVDVELTANFSAQGTYKIGVVQCRPLQVSAQSAAVAAPGRVAPERIVLQSQGAIIGPSRRNFVDRVVYVVPARYGELPIKDRYSVARVIGRLLHPGPEAPPRHIFLIGPGRWGTTTPTLGVPVRFAEIDTVSALCEIVAMREDLIPDVSLGTHFFNDLVEMDILYTALFPGRKGNAWDREFFEGRPNRLAELLPEAAPWQEVLRVIDAPFGPAGAETLNLWADVLEQRVVCWFGE